MVFTAITLLLVLIGLINFREGLVLYLGYKLILVTNITLVALPGVPLLTQEMFLTMWYLLLFLLKGKSARHAKCELPFKLPFCLLVGSWTLSAVFSIAGLSSEVSSLVGDILTNVLLIWMIWEVFETHEMFVKLYKLITAFIFASCIYGFVELALQDNPLVDYEATLIDSSRSVTFIYTDTLSRGYRIQSFFEHCIGAGVNWSIYAVFTFWLWINRDSRDMRGLSGAFMAFALLTAFLCVPCIVLTRMRSPLIFFIICCFSLVNLRSRRFLGFVMAAVVGALILLPLFSANSQILSSLFDSSTQQQIGGSNLEQRIGQFEVAFSLANLSPVVGLGQKYQNVLPSYMYSGMYGSESVWLSTIVCFGWLGTAFEAFYLVWCVVVVPRRFKCMSLFWFMLAYWVTATVTSLPGMKPYLLFLLGFYFIKGSDVYRAIESNASNRISMVRKDFADKR